MENREFMLALTNWYAKHAVGGFLHMVTDDGNLEDDNINWCIEYGKKQVEKKELSQDDYEEGLKIANHFLSISYEEREKLYNQFWDGYRTFMLPFMVEAFKIFS